MLQTQNRKVLLTAVGFLSFFAFGFSDNLKGALLPEVLRTEGLNYSQGAVFLLCAYLGFIAATLLSGVLADFVGNQSVLTIAGFFLCAGFLGIGTNSSYSLLLLFMFVVGLGLGGIEVSANGLMVEIHPKNTGRYFNLLATFHGIGSLLVPLYTAWLIANELNWQVIYASPVVLAIPLALLVFLGNSSPDSTDKRDVNWRWTVVREAGFTPKMLLYYLLITSYVAVELGIAAWMVEYLHQERELTMTQSSFYLSAFFAAIMLGRALGSIIVDRINYSKAVWWALLVGVVCLACGLGGPQAFVWLIPLSGLFFSIVFPTVAATVSNLHRENRGSIMGLLFTFGGIGGAAGPWLIGIVSESFGLHIGLLTTIAFGAIALAAASMLAARKPQFGSDSNV